MDFSYPEGATLLDEDEREGLLISHITIREELNEWEQRNIADAYIWLDRSRNKDILNEDFIRTLHKKCSVRFGNGQENIAKAIKILV